MKRSDLDGDVWTIATEPREKGNPGTLRLPPLAMKIINAQPRLTGNPYVFTGRGKGPLSGFSSRHETFKASLRRRRLDAARPATHRALLIGRTSVRPDIAERVLGHAVGAASRASMTSTIIATRWPTRWPGWRALIETIVHGDPATTSCRCAHRRCSREREGQAAHPQATAQPERGRDRRDRRAAEESTAMQHGAECRPTSRSTTSAETVVARASRPASICFAPESRPSRGLRLLASFTSRGRAEKWQRRGTSKARSRCDIARHVELVTGLLRNAGYKDARPWRRACSLVTGATFAVSPAARRC